MTSPAVLVEGVLEELVHGRSVVRVLLDGEEHRIVCTPVGRVRGVYLVAGDHVRVEVYVGAHGRIGRLVERLGPRSERPTAAQRAQARAAQRGAGGR